MLNMRSWRDEVRNEEKFRSGSHGSSDVSNVHLSARQKTYFQSVFSSWCFKHSSRTVKTLSRVTFAHPAELCVTLCVGLWSTCAACCAACCVCSRSAEELLWITFVFNQQWARRLMVSGVQVNGRQIGPYGGGDALQVSDNHASCSTQSIHTPASSTSSLSLSFPPVDVIFSWCSFIRSNSIPVSPAVPGESGKIGYFLP